MYVSKIRLSTGEVRECNYPSVETMFADIESQGEIPVEFWLDEEIKEQDKEPAYDVENQFGYHVMREDQVTRSTKVRNAAKELAAIVIKNCPKSRERSLALTKIEEAAMWANKSIAANGDK